MNCCVLDERIRAAFASVAGSTMKLALAAVAVCVVVAVVAIGWFPESPVTVAVGWTIYLVLAVVTTTWGMTALGVGAAVAAIWWTLSRPSS